MATATLIMVAVVFQTFGAAPVAPVPAEIEKAVFAENWAKVIELIGEVKPETPVPLRLIMGHACLALNRNNESLALFLGAAAPEDLTAWQAYAQDFQKRHPKVPIACYFVGDSLARAEKYEQAIVVLDAGVRAKPRHVLSLNARGVCLALLGRISEASSVMQNTIEASNSKLADALLSKGMLRVQTSDAPEDANSCFSLARDMTVQNALALHGLALIAFVNGEPDKASDLNDQACLSAQGMAELFLANEEQYTQALIGKVANASDSGGATGTTLSREFTRLSLSIDNYNRVAGQSSFLANARANVGAIPVARQLARMSETDLTMFAQQHPSQVGAAMDAVRREQTSTERNRRGTGVAGNYFQWQGLGLGVVALSPDPALGSAGKAGALGSAVAATAFKGMEHNNTEYNSRLNVVFQELGKGMDRSIQQEIRAGNYKPAYSPDQTAAGLARTGAARTEAAIRSGQYKPVGIPDPLRSPGGQPAIGTDRPLRHDAGGAKTSFADVPWDEGNWPFKPLYGLAYGMIGVPHDTETSVDSNSDAEGSTDDSR